jgi:hypothetical protein
VILKVNQKIFNAYSSDSFDFNSLDFIVTSVVEIFFPVKSYSQEVKKIPFNQE